QVLDRDDRRGDAFGQRDELVAGAAGGDGIERAVGGLRPVGGGTVRCGLVALSIVGLRIVVRRVVCGIVLCALTLFGIVGRLRGRRVLPGRVGLVAGDDAGGGEHDEQDDVEDDAQQPDAARDDPRLLLVAVLPCQRAALTVLRR